MAEWLFVPGSALPQGSSMEVVTTPGTESFS